MSCSQCIKCKNMVSMYEKYCPECVKVYGLASVQNLDFHRTITWMDPEKQTLQMFIDDLKKVHGDNAGKINVYQCPDGHITVTQTLEDGDIPVIMHCSHFHKGKETSCDKWAAIDNKVNQLQKPEFEWYKPNEFQEVTISEYNYAKKGGLLLRKIPIKLGFGCSDISSAVSAACPEPVKIGRNSGCPCGSGKKFKHCCINKI